MEIRFVRDNANDSAVRTVNVSYEKDRQARPVRLDLPWRPGHSLGLLAVC